MTADHETTKGPRRSGTRLRAIACLVGGCASLGCADADDARVLDAELEAPAALLQAEPQLMLRVASVSGPGCPSAASWSLQQVPEQNAFTLTFHQMTVQTPPVQTRVVRETYCDVSLAVAGWQPVSFAVASLQYFGFASLHTGMTGTLGVRHGFPARGAVALRPETRTFLRSPAERSFAVRDDVALTRAEDWSSCALTTQWAMRLRIEMTSENRERAGLVTLSDVDGNASMIRVGFASESCTSGGTTRL
ncbi:MAG: DUF4360 domain-containing protein [Polyangiales bacterium]